MFFGQSISLRRLGGQLRNVTELASGKYVLCGNDATLQITAAATVEAWVNVDGVATTRAIITKSSYSDLQRSYELYFDNATDKFIFLVTTDGSTVVDVRSEVKVADTWYYVCATYDGTNINMYVNGVLENQTAFSAGLHNSTTELAIGTFGGVNEGVSPWDGHICTPAVLNVARTQAEVIQRYDSGINAQWGSLPSDLQTGTKLFLPFNDGVASGNEYLDQSGNGNDGTTTGSPTMTAGGLKIKGTLSVEPIPDLTLAKLVHTSDHDDVLFTDTSPLVANHLAGDSYDYLVQIYSESTDVFDKEVSIRLNGQSGASDYLWHHAIGRGTAEAGLSDSADLKIDIGISHDLFGPTTEFLITGDSSDAYQIHGKTYSWDSSLATHTSWSAYSLSPAAELNSLQFFIEGTTKFFTGRMLVWQIPKAATRGGWELVETKTLTAQDCAPGASPVVWSSLDGDTDGEYRIQGHFAAAASEIYQMTVNGDGGSNYEKNLRALDGSTLNCYHGTSTTCQLHHTFSVGAGRVDLDMIIEAETGKQRLLHGKMTTVSSTGPDSIDFNFYYTEEATNLTSMQLQTVSASSVTGALYLYKKRSTHDIQHDLPYELIETLTPAGDYSTGETATISGDDWEAIRIEGRFTDIQDALLMQLDGSSTAADYTQQMHRLDNGVDTATWNNGASAYYTLIDACTASIYGKFVLTLFPRDFGRARQFLLTSFYDQDKDMQSGGHFEGTGEIGSIKLYGGGSNGITGTIKISGIPKK